MKKIYVLFYAYPYFGEIPTIVDVFSSGKKTIKNARKQPKPSPLFGDWKELEADPELKWHQNKRWKAERLPGFGVETVEMWIERMEVK